MRSDKLKSILPVVPATIFIWLMLSSGLLLPPSSLLPSPALAEPPASQGERPPVIDTEKPPILILDNELYDNGVSAVHIRGNRVCIERCRIYRNGNAGIAVDNSSEARIKDSQIYGQEGAGITVMGKGAATVSVTGNQIRQNKMAGIQLGGKNQLEAPAHDSFRQNPTDRYAQRKNKAKTGEKATAGKEDQPKTEPSAEGDAQLKTESQAGDKAQEGTEAQAVAESQGETQAQAQPQAQAQTDDRAGNKTERENKARQPITITIEIQGNRIYYNGESGIKCQSEYPQNSISLTAERNAIFQNQKGGVFFAGAANVTLRNNSIHENRKAGISANEDEDPLPRADIYQNIIRQNEESGIELTAARSGPIGVCNNLIFNNGGSGIRFGLEAMRIVNNTIVSNGNLSEGSGIDQQEKSTPFIANNILAFNFKTGLNLKRNKGCSYNLLFANGGSGTCCDDCYSSSKSIENKQLGGYKRNRGDMICDPLFNNPDIFDFRLKKWSPAIDAGIPSPEFHDLFFPPSQGGQPNDLGVTGGPLAISWDPNSLIH
ncbi:MAG: right-handed parallel beta-helix repeat-containing protein [bacterium]